MKMLSLDDAIKAVTMLLDYETDIDKVWSCDVINNLQHAPSVTDVEPMQKWPLGDVECGKMVKIGNVKYIVLDHSAETTALITKDFVMEIKFGKDNNYKSSEVRAYLNGPFFEDLAEAVGRQNVIMHNVNLTANDGTNVGKCCRDHVSLLTTELYRRYRQYLLAYGKWWWLATPISDHKDYADCVCLVDSNGVLIWDISVYCFGVRPFCILNSEIKVEVIK